jgi:hypothetical protein
MYGARRNFFCHLRGVLKLGVGEFDAVLFIEMSPPMMYELESLRASRACPCAVNLMYGKLVSLPKLSRREQE